MHSQSEKVFKAANQDDEGEATWSQWWNEIREERFNEQGLDLNFKNKMPFWKKLDDLPVPKISARSWVIVDANSGKLIWGKNEHSKKEIASLTKVMTIYLTLQLIDKMQIDIDKTYAQATNYSSSIGGTSAQLRDRDILTLQDLLYGLMLPSGNDAALTLAENFGVYLYFQTKEFNLKYANNESITNLKINNPANYFVKEMNEQAVKLGLQNTYYSNPHGLSNRMNKSTAYDVAKLCYTTIKHPLVQKIMATRSYISKVQNDGDMREIEWVNTNKLLDYGFSGIKTGITDQAGPCLASEFKTKRNKYIIVLLNSSSRSERWPDTCKLVDWVTQIYEKQ